MLKCTLKLQQTSRMKLACGNCSCHCNTCSAKCVKELFKSKKNGKHIYNNILLLGFRHENVISNDYWSTKSNHRNTISLYQAPGSPDHGILW